MIEINLKTMRGPNGPDWPEFLAGRKKKYEPDPPTSEKFGPFGPFGPFDSPRWLFRLFGLICEGTFVVGNALQKNDISHQVRLVRLVRLTFPDGPDLDCSITRGVGVGRSIPRLGGLFGSR